MEAVFKDEDQNVTNIFRWLSYGLAVLFIVFSVGSLGYATLNSTFIPDMEPIYFVSLSLLICGGTLVRMLLLQRWNWAIGITACFTAILLAFLLLGRPYAEPWVSCEQISEALKKADQSDSIVLCSKFYVRGVRYYTDRPMAVIDINGKGFFSPHPIPFLSTDDAVLQILNKQPVTFCVLKKSNVDDLYRIAGSGFQIEPIEDIGGKYLLKVTKI